MKPTYSERDKEWALSWRLPFLVVLMPVSLQICHSFSTRHVIQEYNQSFNRWHLSFRHNVSFQLEIFLSAVLRVSIAKVSITSDIQRLYAPSPFFVLTNLIVFFVSQIKRLKTIKAMKSNRRIQKILYAHHPRK